MKLYHGTSVSRLSAILYAGILPRKESKQRSQWEHSVVSAADRVYLTDIYAPYFAFHAASRDEASALLLEVDADLLPKEKLVPDEDFLEQATRNQPINGLSRYASMHERTRFFRDRAHRKPELAKLSLQHLGTCAFMGRVPAMAVTRYATVDLKKGMALNLIATDAMVTLLNHRFCSDKYSALTRLIFGERFTPREWVRLTHGHGVADADLDTILPPQVRSHYEEQAAKLMELADAAVTITTL